MFASLATIGSGSIGVPLDLIPPEDFLAGFTFAMIPAMVLSVATFVAGYIVPDEGIGSS